MRPGPLGGLGWSLAVLVLVDAGPGLDVLGWVVGAALALAGFDVRERQLFRQRA